MTSQPDKRPALGILSDPDGKKARWKNILLIVLAVHLVFTVLDSCAFHGPCASRLIEATGPGKVVIDRIEYRVRPRQNEIVMTWTESVMQGRSRWGEGEKHSRSIPLDPMPPEFEECVVDVTVDPDAPPMIPMSFSSDAIAPIPYFGEENVNETDLGVFVFQLRVRPEDVSALSEQFYISFGAHDGTLLLPYSRASNGRRVMLMTTHGQSRPYYGELLWEAEARPRKMPSRLLGLFKRIVLLPFVVIPDYVLDVLSIFEVLNFLHQLSNVDW